MRRQFPYKKTIALLLLVAASVSLMNLTGKPAEGPSFWETLLYKIAGPVVSAVGRARERYDSWRTAFSDKAYLQSENDRLTKELEYLASLEAKVGELEKENARLHELLGFVDEFPGTYEVAKVIGRNPSKWFSTVGISKGALDGITIDSAVVSRSGLVGRITSVLDHTSTVLLITDPESGVGAMVERSRDYGVLLGNSGNESLTLSLFSKEASIRPGDKVLTSGVGSKYPSGILVGEVTSVYSPKPGLVKEALVVPATDLEHLEEVMVIIQ